METPKKRLVISKNALHDLTVRTGARAGILAAIVLPPRPANRPAGSAAAPTE